MIFWLLCFCVALVILILWAGPMWPDLIAVRLNLHPRRYRMAKIGDTKTLQINPTNANGLPAPVTNVVWTFGNSTGVVAPDNLSAVVTFTTEGEAPISVSALSLAGVTLTDDKSYIVDAPPVDQEAVALNLSEA